MVTKVEWTGVTGSRNSVNQLTSHFALFYLQKQQSYFLTVEEDRGSRMKRLGVFPET